MSRRKKFNRPVSEKRKLGILVAAGSAQIPYARATVLARLGRAHEARTAARRPLDLKPSFSDAATLLQLLSPTARSP